MNWEAAHTILVGVLGVGSVIGLFVSIKVSIARLVAIVEPMSKELDTHTQDLKSHGERIARLEGNTRAA